MTKFNLNLGRGFVFTSKTRHLINLIFLIYLLVCGGLIIVICNRASRNIVAAQTLELRIDELSERFANTHPSGITLRAYHDQLLDQIRNQNSGLALLDTHTLQHLPIVQVLVELIEPLPGGVSLNEANYHGENRLLQFSIVIPRGANLSPITSDKLIDTWRKQPLIRAEVDSITAVFSDRTTLNDRDVYIVRFRCVLKGKV
jgi:hypothetical protein